MKLSIIVRLEDGAHRRFNGRVAWALLNLHSAGASGCTPITHPGPRWSHYIFKLRRAGIQIETIHEPHGGPFAGTHARYVLIGKVAIIKQAPDKEAAA